MPTARLLGLNRSTLYYSGIGEAEENLALMKLIDAKYTERPTFGSRSMTTWLQSEGYAVNRKRSQRLMRQMGIEAIYPKPRVSIARKDHKVYPYLLRNVAIERPNHVWATDITYIRLSRGFMYLMAIMDWYSRFVIT